MHCLTYYKTFFRGFTPFCVYKSEFERTFLDKIEEIDKLNGLHDFVTNIEYNEVKMPKRFSIHQDDYGYLSPNSSGSPFPKLKYKNIFGNFQSSDGNSGFEKLYGFWNKNMGQVMHVGRPGVNTGISKRGSLKSVVMASGASISYQYESNTLPNIDNPSTPLMGAGLRVVSKTENPGNEQTPKVTKYTYENPTFINLPIRISQNAYNYYYNPSLEQKISTTSQPQNEVFLNKNNIVGYGKVTEEFSGNGKILHVFSTPSFCFDKNDLSA